MVHDDEADDVDDDEADDDFNSSTGASRRPSWQRWQPPPSVGSNMARTFENIAKQLRLNIAPMVEVVPRLSALERRANSVAQSFVRNRRLLEIQATAVQGIAGQLQQYHATWLEGLREQLNKVVQLDLSGIAAAIRRGVPPNWQGLGDEVRLSELFDVTEAGYPTAWVPRPVVLQELAQATTDEQRSQVFASHQAEIIEDCRTVTEDIDAEDLVDLAEMLDEMLTVAEAGYLRAAQAFAASIFDTVLRYTIAPERISGYYSKVKTEIEKHHENATLAELRWGLVHVPAVVALQMFNAPGGDPVPKRFNRHASAHAVGPAQYTPANAVMAVALATSLVREAQEQIDEETDETD